MPHAWDGLHDMAYLVESQVMLTVVVKRQRREPSGNQLVACISSGQWVLASITWASLNVCNSGA